jgi:acyl carrier protein
VAYVVRDAPAAPEPADMQQSLRTRLPAYMVPGTYVVLDALPRTPNGKLDRAGLPAPASARAPLAPEALRAQTPFERRLAQIWQELLGVDEVSVRDNFFDLGGHSLLSMRVVVRLERETGVRVNPGELIVQTLGQVAQVCERMHAATAAPAGARGGWTRRLLRRLPGGKRGSGPRT